MKYGNFIDQIKVFAISRPDTPRPWINYLGNRRLNAFIGHNGGGLLWFLEPYCRRVSRYHYTAAPGDRPGFYIYVKDRSSGTLWNPHFAPVCQALEYFECLHEPGISSFIAEKDGLRIELQYGIPPNDDVMLWQVKVTNISYSEKDIQISSYLEFGLLEFMREAIGWCYLKNQYSLFFDAEHSAIYYDYHVFEAPDCPAMAFGCSEKIVGYECSRDIFIGLTGDYGRPEALSADHDLSNSELPDGGHACAALGVDLKLEPEASKTFSYIFSIGDNQDKVWTQLEKFKDEKNVQDAFGEIRSFWQARLEHLQIKSTFPLLDSFINTWTPYNAIIALQYARTISTDHMGTDGLRFRDTTQDALAVANLDPDFAMERMTQVFAQQKSDGSGCMSFYPDTNRKTTDEPRRSDNAVWLVYTMKNLIAETGNISLLDKVIPFRDKGEATVYDHMMTGLKNIYLHRGPNGLPLLLGADWNDGLALFGDERAESVMLGMQLVYSCREIRELAAKKGLDSDIEWCDSVIDELTEILNSDLVWDGKWYRRLILSNGTPIGSSASSQGRIYLNPQSWAVISGVADYERGRTAMDSVAEYLDSEYGIAILAPSFKGFPNPEDPPKGSNPGIGENGGIFCHANTWAIIAECLLNNPETAFKYYKQLLPESIISKIGEEHYQREPYVYVSSLVGPENKNHGQGGISWLTGTASWMYIAATHYILGIRPTLDGLAIKPCLPWELEKLNITRSFRGCKYDIEINNPMGRKISLIADNAKVAGGIVLPADTKHCLVTIK